MNCKNSFLTLVILSMILILGGCSEDSSSPKLTDKVVYTVATLTDSTAFVVENSAAGTRVGTVTISDAGNTAITAITLSDTTNFEVSTTGAITVKEGASLDFETRSSYSLTAIATNSAGDSTSVNVTITLINVIDTVATLADSTAFVVENSAAGTTVGTVAISNTGDSAIIVMTLSDTRNFEVSPTGAITVKAGASLDFERTSSFSLTAIATNSAGDSAKVNVSITVLNVVETVPVLSPFTVFVDEDATIGTAIGNIRAAVEGSSIIGFTLSDTTNFEVDTAGQIRTKTTLDYARTTSYALTVFATNSLGNSSRVSVTINVARVPESAPSADQGEAGQVDIPPAPPAV